MDILIGIDIGSTSLKAIAYAPDGRAVARASRPTELVHPDSAHPDWAIWRPEQIWGGVAESLKEAVAKLPAGAAVRGVAVTGMGMDAVPIDKDGRWLYPFISWHCPRTLPQQQWWIEHVGAERQFAVSGNIIWGFNTAFRILWIREHEPDVHRKTDRWLLIEDFLNFMLCGERATDYSMASSTLLFDQARRGWSDEILSIAGIDRSLLCPPRPSGTVIGTVHRKAAEATGLPAGTPVVLGGHDFLCGALPVGAHRPGVILDLVGTWEIVMAPLDRPILTPSARDMGWWIDSHVARNAYAAVGCAVAADMIEWFRKLCGFEEAQQAKEKGGVDWDYLMASAREAPPGAGGVMFLPHMSGCTFPVVDPQSMGAFVGLRNIASKGHLLRAMVEGLNFQFLQILEGLKTALGVSPDRFVAVGGGAQNAFWVQNKADMVGRPIETPEIEEATPLGAAILAGIGVGIYRDEEDAYRRVYRPGRTFEPQPGLAAAYAERFEAYRKLYPALRDVHGTLRKLG